MPIHLGRDQVSADALASARASVGSALPELVARYRDFAPDWLVAAPSSTRKRPLDGSTAQGSHICLRLLKLRVVGRGFSIGAATSLGLAASTELLAPATVSTIDG